MTAAAGAAAETPVGDVLRRLGPRVLARLVRRHGDLDRCEDAVQEAMLAAATRWPVAGRPDLPEAWLLAVATRRLADRWRADCARRRREATAAALVPAHDRNGPAADEPVTAADDTLTLLVMCCHPALTVSSQVALTLRAVAGLTTAEVAEALLVPEATMTRRISRAKQRVAEHGVGPVPSDLGLQTDRLAAVRHVLYLVFTEGHTASSGARLHRVDLTTEAIRLTRELQRALPDDAEVAGLLALMLLTEARRSARVTADGGLVPLAEQDRSRWDRTLVAEGVALLERTLPRGPVGPLQLQAAIAAVHVEADRAEDTDWPQIVALYELLDRLSPGPVVTLNRAVAVGMTHGPRAGLALLAPLDGDARVARRHRLAAVRAHLLEMAGDVDAARRHYRDAARRTTSVPEQRYLLARLASLP